MKIHAIIDAYAIHYDTFAGDVYTLDTASITLTAGSLVVGGTITSGDITIFDATPILVFKDSDSLGAASVGFIEWRDSGGGRAGFLGNHTSGNDDLLWKNEQGGNIGIETTGAGEFQVEANTVLSGTLASGKHTITSTTRPQLDIDGDTGASNLRLRATNDTGAAMWTVNLSEARVYYESIGNGFQFRTALLADMIADPAVPGDNDVLRWGIDVVGNVTMTAGLSGVTTLAMAGALSGVTDLAMNGTLTGAGNIYIATGLIHTGDTNTSLSFSTDQIDLYAGGDSLFQINTTNVMIGDHDGGNYVGVSSTTGITTFAGTSAINGLKLKTRAVTANTDLTATDDVLTCGAGDETFTVDLPTVVDGKVFFIKNVGTGVITVDANVDGGTTIDGDNTQTLNQYECLQVIADASVYWAI